MSEDKRVVEEVKNLIGEMGTRARARLLPHKGPRQTTKKPPRYTTSPNCDEDERLQEPQGAHQDTGRG
jgi:hypothetical protein